MTKNLWIDLTDISVWNGHHTGIQRLVYQVAKRFYKAGQVNFFVFDERTKTFRKFYFETVEKQIKTYEKNHEARAYAPPPDRLKAIAYKVYASSPFWLKDRMASPANKARIRRAYKIINDQLHKPPATKTNLGPEPKEIHFGSDDTVLIMGKIWDYYPDYIETLSRAKRSNDFRLVQVVYDLIPIHSPHLFGQPLIEPYTKHMFETVAISDGLLAISKSTKKDMHKFCQEMRLPTPPIEVIRLGDDFIEAVAKKPTIPGIEKGNYLLSVGTLEARKNHQLLYMAYREGILRKANLPQLVIVGGAGWYTGDIIYQLTNDPLLKNRVHIMQDVNDQELKWLYENCLFTIYPSVYEGWGLPVAESLAYGKMCLTSNISSMPEIAGKLIDYFSPYDSGACLEAIMKYLNPTELARKEAEIQRSYYPTPWDETFRQVQQFLQKRADEGR